MSRAQSNRLDQLLVKIISMHTVVLLLCSQMGIEALDSNHCKTIRGLRCACGWQDEGMVIYESSAV